MQRQLRDYILKNMIQRQDESVRATIAGSAFTLSRSLVEDNVAGVLPDPINEHYVVVAGRRYPPKQVVALVSGLDRADFTTHQARRILRRLGFPVGRRTKGVATPQAEVGPHGDAEAEALRPYVGKWVAQKGIDVVVAADTPEEVFEWLHRHDVYADGMFRVPERPADVRGAAPL